jgi:hypothetical protein
MTKMDYRDIYITENSEKLKSHNLRIVKEEDYYKFLKNPKLRISPWIFILVFLGLIALSGVIFYLGYTDKINFNFSANQTCQGIPEIPKCPDIPICPGCPSIPVCPNLVCGNYTIINQIHHEF